MRTTFSDEEIHGEVFCCDVCTSNVLVLKECRDNGNANFRIIKIPSIKEVVAESRPPERGGRRETAKERNDDTTAPESLLPALPGCDFNVLERRERRSIEAFQQKQHTIGVGVTREAQDIFDFIHKTHPGCRWDGDSIVVMGVKVTPPYSPDSAVGGEDKRTLERLKKVLHGFHNRATQRKKAGNDPVPTRSGGNSAHRSSNKRAMQDASEANLRARWSWASELSVESNRTEEKHNSDKGKTASSSQRELHSETTPVNPYLDGDSNDLPSSSSRESRSSSSSGRAQVTSETKDTVQKTVAKGEGCKVRGSGGREGDGDSTT